MLSFQYEPTLQLAHGKAKHHVILKKSYWNCGLSNQTLYRSASRSDSENFTLTAILVRFTRQSPQASNATFEGWFGPAVFKYNLVDRPWGPQHNIWLHSRLYWCQQGHKGQLQLMKQNFQFLNACNKREVSLKNYTTCPSS